MHMYLGMTIWTGIAFGYHILSRLAYVTGVGWALRLQDRTGYFTRQESIRSGFVRFRKLAAALIYNDSISFVILCVLARESGGVDLDRSFRMILGAFLIAVGSLMKIWAAMRIGPDAYYWYNFFDRGTPNQPDPPGPYRYFRNSMYTVGYLHMYGLALVFASGPGLIAAAFDQGAILLFYRKVEKPHFDQLRRISQAGRTGEA